MTGAQMHGRDIVVIGASAGGIEPLTALVRGLPADFPGSLFVVVHFPSSGISSLPAILSRAGSLPARHAVDGETIEPGRIYVAKPGWHLLIEDERLALSRGPKENGHRPAVDPLFRSAARTYGPRVVGIVLSGNLNDGAAGLYAVKRQGGFAVAQSLESALYEGMPRSAMENVEIDYTGAPAQIAQQLNELVEQTFSAVEVLAMAENHGADEAADEFGLADRHVQPGVPSTMSCPECHGVLWEVKDDELVRFRCRVGHAYSAEALMAHQAENLEAALWTALRALEEHCALARRLAARANSRGHAHSAATFTEQAVGSEHHASVIRNVLHSGRRNGDSVDPAVAAAG
jgi:two-component system, chemotaxis family, protein-glutamate methylesterase/glutaminase